MQRVSDVASKYDELVNIALYFTHDEEKARDIVQTVYLKLCEIERREGNLNRLCYNGSINKSYLFTMIRNEFLDRQKLNNKHVDIGYASCYYVETDEYEDFKNELFNKSIEVARRYQNVNRGWYTNLHRHYFEEGKSIRMIARGASISTKAIFVGLKHLKEILRNELKPLYDEYRNSSKS